MIIINFILLYNYYLMSQQLTDTMIINYIEELRNINYIINDHLSYISTLNNKIQYIKNILQNNCKHIPTIDHNSTSERTEYYCSRCLSSL